MRIRHIQTEVIDGKTVPVLDANGNDIELWSVEVPREIEIAGFPADVDQTNKAAIEAYISAETARRRAPAPTPTPPADLPADEPFTDVEE